MLEQYFCLRGDPGVKSMSSIYFSEIQWNPLNCFDFQEINKKSPPGRNVAVAHGIIGVLGCHFHPEVDFTLNFRNFKDFH